MERTWKPTVAGILDLIAAGYGLMGGCALLMLAGMFASRMFGMGDEGPAFGRFFTTGLFHILGWAHILCGMLAIPGGILNLQRRAWSWAVIFSVAAIVRGFRPRPHRSDPDIDVGKGIQVRRGTRARVGRETAAQTHERFSLYYY